MSKLQRFREFVNERLAAAALELSDHYEKTIAACQDELRRSREECSELQRMLNLERLQIDVKQIIPPGSPQIKEEQDLWTSQDGDQISIPEPPQIEEEQKMWTSQGEEQLPGVQSDSAESIFTSSSVVTHRIPEEWSPQPPIGQTTVEYRSVNTIVVQVKTESDEENHVALEPDRESQSPSIVVCLESEENAELLPEPTACPPRLQSTKLLKSIIKPRKGAKCCPPIHSSGSVPIFCLETKNTATVSSHSGVERDASSRQADVKTAEEHQCAKCGQAFTCKSALVIHLRSHTGEKPYKCGECGQAFSQQGNLKQHKRTHTGEKPYKCQQCDHAFSLKRNLVNHERVHTGEKPYKCGECDQAFRIKSSLVNHRRIHTGEKPYECEECHRAFSLLSNLAQHRKVHTEVKP